MAKKILLPFVYIQQAKQTIAPNMAQPVRVQEQFNFENRVVMSFVKNKSNNPLADLPLKSFVPNYYKAYIVNQLNSILATVYTLNVEIYVTHPLKKITGIFDYGKNFLKMIKKELEDYEAITNQMLKLEKKLMFVVDTGYLVKPYFIVYTDADKEFDAEFVKINLSEEIDLEKFYALDWAGFYPLLLNKNDLTIICKYSEGAFQVEFRGLIDNLEDRLAVY